MVDYSTQAYWNKRFSGNTIAYEWLREPEVLVPIIRQLSAAFPEEQRRILHIGPGSSKLSLHLRDLVQTPSQIHNVDFSDVGLEVGKDLERESASHSDENELTEIGMIWTRIDLLDPSDIISLQLRSGTYGPYNIVIDKSTSDAIACGEPVEIDSLEFNHEPGLKQTSNSLGQYKIYPVWRLALHMAAVTEPGALWITLSYKEERFCFLSPSDSSLDLNGKDLPSTLLPTRYWTLRSKDFKIDEMRPLDNPDGPPVHRPVEGKWLLVLQRTREYLALNDKITKPLAGQTF